MHQNDQLPPVPDDDPETDRLLAGTGRFSPQRGFEDRVVGRVQVPAPRWVRGIRERGQALTSGVTGWTVLVTFSLATAAAWGSAAIMGARYSGEIALAWNQGGREAVRLLRRSVVEALIPVWGAVQSGLGSRLATIGLDLQTAAVGYGAVILVCAVALRWLTAEPRKTRGPV